MENGSPLCVTDSNIWIDLDHGNLIRQAFKLTLKLTAPDVVVAELQIPDGSALVHLGLEPRELSGRQVQNVLDLARRYRRPSRVDLFSLVLARDLDALLLTGDGALRDAARDEGVEVHGTLWLLDLMLDQGVIDGQGRADALESMVRCGGRFPDEEVRSRVDRWRTGR